eukprot:UN26249
MSQHFCVRPIWDPYGSCANHTTETYDFTGPLKMFHIIQMCIGRIFTMHLMNFM